MYAYGMEAILSAALCYMAYGYVGITVLIFCMDLFRKNISVSLIR